MFKSSEVSTLKQKDDVYIGVIVASCNYPDPRVYQDRICYTPAKNGRFGKLVKNGTR